VNYFFYIVENIATSNPTDQGLDTRILKVPADVIVCKIKEGDGPYKSIRNLKRNSKIFHSFLIKGSRQVAKLLNDNNIVSVKDLIITPNDREYSKEFIKLFDHTVRGQIKNKNVYGLHFYDPERIRIIEITRKENTNGVWAAMVEVFDKSTHRWIAKEKETTFFPKNWTITQLFHECDFAYVHKKKIDSKICVYSSRTLSGVRVDIIIENNEVKTIYPLID